MRARTAKELWQAYQNQLTYGVRSWDDLDAHEQHAWTRFYEEQKLPNYVLPPQGSFVIVDLDDPEDERVVLTRRGVVALDTVNPAIRVVLTEENQVLEANEVLSLQVLEYDGSVIRWNLVAGEPYESTK
jgi:hypothetical protein